MNKKGEEGVDSQGLEGLVRYLGIAALVIILIFAIKTLIGKIT